MNNLQLIEKALYYIDENLCEELTYERLAEVFGYSSFHFHKIFSSVTELTITEYIRKRRLTVAHKKLCETAETVADICYSVGFNSIQTFNRAFKDTFGMQPLVAREKQAKITYRTVEEIITVCRFGTETMGLRRIEAFAHVDNIGSNRTLQKAGFAHEGTLRKRFEVKGELFDCNAYSFVKSDLESR